jgi:rSAM/selenodomain-associated transferase 1
MTGPPIAGLQTVGLHTVGLQTAALPTAALPTARVQIAIMAKAPLPGLAKTRLAPVLGASGAAALAAQMLDHAVAQAVAAALGPVTVWATPDATHPAFLRLQQRHGVALAVQPAGDIGQRMAAAFAAHGGPLLLMGADLPGISAAVLQQAAAALAHHDAVLVPALDGGYGLIALHRPAPSLFDGLAWSTPAVLAQTRQRLVAAGLRHAELAAVADIDEPADLAHLPAAWRVSLQTLHEDPLP